MWVIEQYRQNQLHYWGGATLRRENMWATTFRDAVKFADRESANRVLTDLCEGLGRVAEHRFVETAAT